VAAVPTKDQVVTTVDRIVNGDIRTQDGFWVLARLLVGKGGQTAWESARTRWSDVLARMPGMTKRRIPEGLSGLSQPEVAADVKAFFAETPLPEAATSLAQNLELLDANVLLRARETPVVTEYFK
jgi:ERAP1-like C-terminal domain